MQATSNIFPSWLWKLWPTVLVCARKPLRPTIAALVEPTESGRKLMSRFNYADALDVETTRSYKAIAPNADTVFPQMKSPCPAVQQTTRAQRPLARSLRLSPTIPD